MGGMAILQLCRWKFSQKKLCIIADFIRLKLNFILKKQKNRFLSYLWGIRGNVRTPSIVYWKARCRIPIRHN